MRLKDIEIGLVYAVKPPNYGPLELTVMAKVTRVGVRGRVMAGSHYTDSARADYVEFEQVSKDGPATSISANQYFVGKIQVKEVDGLRSERAVFRCPASHVRCRWSEHAHARQCEADARQLERQLARSLKDQRRGRARDLEHGFHELGLRCADVDDHGRVRLGRVTTAALLRLLGDAPSLLNDLARRVREERGEGEDAA